MAGPMLTVVVTAYNYGRYLAQCISSILSQDYQNFELIILDNASTDHTQEILSSFSYDKRVKCIKHEMNIGAYVNFNLAFKAGSGRFLAIVSADDYLLPGHFSKLLSGLESNPHCALAYSSRIFVDDNGIEIEPPEHIGYAQSSYAGGRNELIDLLRYDCYITLNAVIFDRDKLRDELYFSINAWGGSDWELYVRIAAKHAHFLFEKTPTACYRLHSSQYTSTTFYQTLEPVYSHLAVVRTAMPYLTKELIKKFGGIIADLLVKRISFYEKDRLREVQFDLDHVLSFLNGKKQGAGSEKGMLSIVCVLNDTDLELNKYIQKNNLQATTRVEFVFVINLELALRYNIRAGQVKLNGVDVRYVVVDNKCHYPASCNSGVLATKGEFVLVHDGGTVIPGSCIAEVINLFESKENIGLLWALDKSTYNKGIENIPSCLAELLQGRIVKPVIFFRRNIFDVVGGYSLALAWGDEQCNFLLDAIRIGVEVSCINSIFSPEVVGCSIQNEDVSLLRVALLILHNPVYFSEDAIKKSSVDLLKHGEALSSLLKVTHENYPSSSSSYYLNQLLSSASTAVDDSECTTQPFFSIVLATFNRAVLFEFALNSLDHQTFKNFEVIVVNDAGENVEHILDKYPLLNITYVKKGKNGGLSAARNTALRLVKGKYVCYLDDDDLFNSNHLQILYENLIDHSERVVYTNADYVLERIEASKRTELSRNNPYVHRDFSIDDLLIQNYIPVNTFCHPSDFSLLGDAFDESLPALEDWDLLLKLRKKYDLHHVNLNTVEVRVREKEIQPEDRMSHRQRKNFPALFRKIYARNGDNGSLYVIDGRKKLLSELDAEMGLPPSFKVAVVLHLFYLDQWDEIKPLLLNIPYGFDLFVSTIAENNSAVMAMLAADFPKAKLYITENKGRDIGPLFELLQHENLANYDFVCKLHTKKSPHLDPELVQKWREELLVSLLPSKEGVQAIFDLFNTRPEVGIVTGAGVLVHAHYTPGGNIGLLRELAARLGFNLDETAYEFPGGSMFWCRGSVFNSFNALNISVDDFEAEAGQTNGTLAHAIERLFPLIAYHQGLLTVDAGYQGHVPNPRFPNSSEEYLHWLSKQALSIPEAKLFDLHAAAVSLPKVKICIVDRFANKSGLIASINSVSRQFYADVELLVCSSAANPMPASGIEWIQVEDGFYSAVLDTLAQQECAWLGLMEAGDQLTMSGLLLAMHQLAEHPEWKAVYFDDDVMNADGRPACPRFKPDFDINLLRSIPYADGFLLLRTDAAFVGIYQQLEGWGGEQLTLLLHCYEQYGAKSIGHIPELVTHLQINDSRILSDPRRYKDFSQLIEMHLQRAGVDAEVLPNGRVEGAVRVKYALPERPLVSIIIPTKNQLPMLQRCIESILEKTSYSNYEIIIIDNNSDDPQVQPYLEQLELLLSDRLRVFSYPHAFNFSAINNAAVGQANGEYLVLLNNDTAMIQDSWLDELLHHAMRPEVGIVGAKLLYPNGLVQHAGVVLGLRGPADHPFIGASLEESGYMHRLQLDQQYSVVTAACMMIRKSVYVQAGGMDEQEFKVSYNDVDLCLKVRELGYSTVWTPYSVVMHEGSVSQTQINPDKAAAKQLRFEGEQLAMYRKWRPEIGNDPAYNKNLTLSGNGFELEHRSLLSWRPLSWKPLPVVLCHPADQTGCGQYRILQPFAAMQEEQKISGAIAFELFPAFELAKLAPDVMVFQRQISAQQIDFLRLSKACAPSFKVYELDDYLPNIPIKSAHRSHMPKDVVKSLRKALTFVDRFTVSTDELASAYQGMHSVMHVVNNYLPVPLWGDLHSERNQGKKPRVGWAGGASHTGDLELIESVVKALAHEVEWVFFGMCPDKLRPFVHEFHAGVPIGLYPAKLASLNLDLALAPLEQNIFNQCKSNLRLLEYGVCGFPVICTDIAPYRGSLPVTRVKNKHKDWVEAIRSHLADRDASARMGRELKAGVLKDWMLDGANLDKWREAWLPN
ncbi:MAG: hypothetical protein RL571_525 [Pseudomonadota bacterium]|jgi:glycosyltransferase involved in cell wall biosynthesis